MSHIYMRHPETGGAGLVSSEPGVAEMYEARGWERWTIPPELDPDAPNADTVAQAEQAYESEPILTEEQVAELKGQALDEALDKAGLAKSGTADEKRARLAEYEAGLANTTDEGEK